MAVIEVERLVKSYADLKAVDDISFEVKDGSIFGFLGPNGAGKTTTINVLCTLLNPTSGSARVAGHDCATEAAAVRSAIGLVFQDTTLDKDLTAKENLVFHAFLYAVPRREIEARVKDALHFAGLWERRDHVVKKFSGGMKRRLEVARGTIHRPRVLFLDEPTIGLDPQSRANLWEYIAELPSRHGVTVFMTTHYMEEAEVCDRIGVIDHGRIIAEESPSELKKLVGGDVITLKTTDNRRAGRMLKSELSLDSEEHEGDLLITTARGDRCIPDLIRTLGDLVVSVQLKRPTLNDVFLKLTGKAIRDVEADRMAGVKEDVRAYRRRQDR